MENDYFILVTNLLLSLAIRTSYELLKEAKKINSENKIIFSIILTVMIALWVSWFGLCPLDPWRLNLPDILRWAGLALFIIGLTTAIGALIQLRGVENINHLVTTGFFKRIRHPMYCGFILWIVGWSIYYGALVSLAIGLVGIVNILFWMHLEDDRLKIQFGDAYEQYRLKIWF
jgi:protein-S-isoprenylcysteine O-methyltransferase Ste14